MYLPNINRGNDRVKQSPSRTSLASDSPYSNKPPYMLNSKYDDHLPPLHNPSSNSYSVSSLRSKEEREESIARERERQLHRQQPTVSSLMRLLANSSHIHTLPQISHTNQISQKKLRALKQTKSNTQDVDEANISNEVPAIVDKLYPYSKQNQQVLDDNDNDVKSHSHGQHKRTQHGQTREEERQRRIYELQLIKEENRNRRNISDSFSPQSQQYYHNTTNSVYLLPTHQHDYADWTNARLNFMNLRAHNPPTPGTAIVSKQRARYVNRVVRKRFQQSVESAPRRGDYSSHHDANGVKQGQESSDNPGDANNEDNETTQEPNTTQTNDDNNTSENRDDKKQNRNHNSKQRKPNANKLFIDEQQRRSKRNDQYLSKLMSGSKTSSKMRDFQIELWGTERYIIQKKGEEKGNDNERNEVQDGQDSSNNDDNNDNNNDNNGGDSNEMSNANEGANNAVNIDNTEKDDENKEQPVDTPPSTLMGETHDDGEKSHQSNTPEGEKSPSGEQSVEKGDDVRDAEVGDTDKDTPEHTAAGNDQVDDNALTDAPTTTTTTATEEPTETETQATADETDKNTVEAVEQSVQPMEAESTVDGEPTVDVEHNDDNDVDVDADRDRVAETNDAEQEQQQELEQEQEQEQKREQEQDQEQEQEQEQEEKLDDETPIETTATTANVSSDDKNGGGLEDQQDLNQEQAQESEQDLE